MPKIPTYPALTSLDDDDLLVVVDVSASDATKKITVENTGFPRLINTDGDPGDTIYVGSIDPDVSYTLAEGDVWIETPV